ncbi:MAG: lactoylglutathione lyase [Psittacicella sp.]
MKILHTMLRVGNLDRSIAFYKEVFGMKELARKENEAGKYTLVFLGWGENVKDEATIELTYNWSVEEYELGTAYGHIAIEVEDIEATYAKSEEVLPGSAIRAPGKVKGMNNLGSVIAFVEDPDKYKIELIQKATLDL